MLRDEGRSCAEAFLQQDRKNIGVRSSYDLDALMEGI
jgi:NTE family protein